MAVKVFGGVWETFTTGGTGAITLDGPKDASKYWGWGDYPEADGETVGIYRRYGGQWEYGTAVYSAGSNTLSSFDILKSTNPGNAPINWPAVAGKDVWSFLPPELLLQADAENLFTAPQELYRAGAGTSGLDLYDLRFSGDNSAGTRTAYAEITGRRANGTAGVEDGSLKIRTRIDGTTGQRIVVSDGLEMFCPVRLDGQTLYLDADRDTYLRAATDDQLDFFRAGVRRMSLTDGLAMLGPVRLDGQALAFDADRDTYFSASADDQLDIYIANTYFARFIPDAIHALLIGKVARNTDAEGIILQRDGLIYAGRGNDIPLIVNRTGNDGTLIRLDQGGTTEGSISVSGATVSYNTFTGGHDAQWATGHEPATEPPLGTVLVTVDEEYERQVVEWEERPAPGRPEVTPGTRRRRWRPGQPVPPGGRVVAAPKPQLTKVRVATEAGDRAVYGLYGGLTEAGDINVHALGTDRARVVGAARRGDLLETSNTPGVARVQADDVVRSSTLGKVTRGDGRTDERLVPCVVCCG